MGQNIKPEGWEKRLDACIDRLKNEPFKWGQHDCSLFALDCADAQFGTSFASNWRGKYKNYRGAYRILEQNGGYSEILESYGFVKKPILMAKRGDLAFIGGDMAMGVVVGDRIIATAEDGLKSVPISRALYVWELPCHQ
jgi:hypothetical protein